MRGIRVRSAIATAIAAATALACGDGEVVEPAVERVAWSNESDSEPVDESKNAAPVIRSVRLIPDEPAAGDRVRAVVDASDPEGDRLALAFVWHVGGDTQSSGAQELTLGELAPGEWVEVTVVASDGRATSDAVEARVQVRNRRPVVTRVVLTPGGAVSRGDTISAMAEGRDPDGSPLEFTYTWLVNDRYADEGTSLDTSSLRAGDTLQVSVVASDGTDDSDPIVSAPVRVANGRPQILSTPTAGLQDGVFRYEIEARDPDGDRNLRYYLKTAPDGMTIDGMFGRVTWRPRADQSGKHSVEVVVEDSAGDRATQDFELEISVDAPTSPPASQGS